MRRLAIAAFRLVIVACLFSNTSLEAATGFVTKRKAGCDYFIVETSSGDAVLEWYGGNDPDVGDKIVGKFEEYGMKDIYNATRRQELRVWVEDYWLSEDDAIEKLYEECD